MIEIENFEGFMPGICIIMCISAYAMWELLKIFAVWGSLLPGKDKRTQPQAAPGEVWVDIRKNFFMARIVKRENGLPRLVQSLQSIT